MADAVVDLHQTFDFTTLDTTSLDANDSFATTGRWTINDASSKLSTSTDGEMAYSGTINSVADAGTRGLMYDSNGGAQAYLSFSHPSQRTVLSGGFLFMLNGAGFFGSFGEYDLCRNSTDLGADPSLLKVVDDTNETRFHAFVPSDYSTGIAIEADVPYWVTFKHTKNDTFVATLYNASTGEQMGAEQSLAVANENLTAFLFGPFAGENPDVDSRLYLDDLILDWTSAVYPLFPFSSEELAAGDLTTAFVKWLDGKTSPKNEAIRQALNDHYGTTNADIQPLVAQFLRDRE